MYKRAFTLIELLVVVAIIAILAAILFPVFARARAQARRAVCASNFSEGLKCIQLYMGDYADRLVPMMYTADWCGDDNPTWPQLVMPYVKNWYIFRCPADINATDDRLSFTNNESTSSATPSEIACAWGMRTDLGYNYAFLAPVVIGDGRNGIPNGSYQARPTNLARVGHPSSTLALADSIWWRDAKSRLPAGGGNWTVDPPCDKIKAQSILPYPHLVTVWYSLGWYTTTAASINLWMEYGGVWPWHGNPNYPEALTSRAGVCFLDGHVKHLNLQQISAGCDLKPKCTGNIIDLDRYIWDIE